MDNSSIARFDHLNRLFCSFLRQQAFNGVSCFANIFLAIINFTLKIAFFAAFLIFVRKPNFYTKIWQLHFLQDYATCAFSAFLNGNLNAFCNPRVEHKFQLSTGKKFERRMFIYNTFENVDEFGKL